MAKAPAGEWLLVCRDTLGFLQQDGVKLCQGRQWQWDSSLPSHGPQCHCPNPVPLWRGTPRHQPCQAELPPASWGQREHQSCAQPGGHHVTGLAAVQAHAGISDKPNVELSVRKHQKATSIPMDWTQQEQLSQSHLCCWGHAHPPAWHLSRSALGLFFSIEAYGKLDFYF